MKIFYFSGATLPSDSAQSVHVMRMCRAMADDAKDNAVTLFAKGGGGVSDEEIFNYYGVDENFSLVLSYNLKIPVLTGILRLLGHYWAMQEQGRPDLVYGRDPVELDYLSPERVMTVFEAHQMPTSFLQRRSIKKLVRRGKYFRLVTITDGLRQDFLKAFPGLNKDRIFVAPDGADIPVKTPAPKELPGRSDAPKVGYTGSLYEGKGMEVIAVLGREAPEFDFHVVGGTPQQVQEWRTKKIPDNVYMHGHARPADIPPYLAAFDILMAPYRTRARIKSGKDIARWISPLKIFEYMAAKKPVICSDLPVIREVLNDKNSVLVPPDDVRAWVTGLRRLKDDPGFGAKLAEAAFDDLAIKYSWKQRARNILKFVDKGI